MEVTLGRRTFIIGKVPAMSGFHVLRRYLPVSQAQAAVRRTGDEETDAQAVGEATITGWGKLSEEDTNYIFSECLSRVQLKNDNGTLTPLWIGGHSGQLTAQDIELGDLMGLITMAVDMNLRPTSTDAASP